MMKPIVFLFLILGLFSFKTPSKKVWMIGDSTMAIKAKNKYPETGWGVPFAGFFTDDVEVVNLAKNGRSTKSFRAEGLWDSVANNVKAGDYVFIQFGHNDEKVDKPAVGTNLEEFEVNLRAYAQEVLDKKAYPILLTPIARRKYENGKLIETHGEYGNIASKVANSMNIPCIDLTRLSGSLIEKFGEETSKNLFLHVEEGDKNYPKGVIDNTHLNEKGAAAIANIVAQQLREQNNTLAKYLK